IVADRHSEYTPGRLGEHCMISGTESVTFTIALAAGEIDVEHMDFVVSGYDRTVRVDQIRAVSETPLGFGYPRLADRTARRGADQHPYTGFLCDLTQCRERGMVDLVACFFAPQLANRL